MIACLAILADKDAAAMIARLAPALGLFVFTGLDQARLRSSGRPGARAWEASELVSLCSAQGGESVGLAVPAEALALARREAEEREGTLLVAGSHYLLADALEQLGGG